MIIPLPLTDTLVRAFGAGITGAAVAFAIAAVLNSMTAATWVGALLVLVPASLAGLTVYVTALVLLGVNEARRAVDLGVSFGIRLGVRLGIRLGVRQIRALRRAGRDHP